MKNNNQNVGGGIGFFSLLTIVLVMLKLTGYINWSWIWVLSPIWLPITSVLVIFGILFFILSQSPK